MKGYSVHHESKSKWAIFFDKSSAIQWAAMHGGTSIKTVDVEISVKRLTKRAVDDAERRAFEKAHDHTYGYNSLCGLCNPNRN